MSGGQTPGPIPSHRRRLRAGAVRVRDALGRGLWLGLAVLGWGCELVVTAPERLGHGVAGLWAELAATTRWRGRLLGLAVLLGLVTLPGWAGRPLVAAMIGVLWLAYTGQAWNLLAGFAGSLSLGHVLFVGLGATLGLGLSPWLGLVLATLVAMAAAAGVATAIGALALRCGRNHGVAFALLTLVFAEAGRLGFSQLGGWGGLAATGSRGGPVVTYYLMLALTIALLVLSRHLLRSRLGLSWLAVREEPLTAATVGVAVTRARLSAMALSAALTAPAGLILAWGTPQAATEPLLSLTRSIEIGLVAMVGGLGTLFGPVLGAFVVAPLASGLDWLSHRPGHHALPGLTGFAIGLALVLVVVLLPGGLWPVLARRLGLLVPGRHQASRHGANPHDEG